MDVTTVLREQHAGIKRAIARAMPVLGPAGRIRDVAARWRDARRGP